MARKRMSAEERRADLVQHAATLFMERGVEATAVSDVVRAANVAQGTFYYHFQSKEAVLDEALDLILDNLIRGVEWKVSLETTPGSRLECLVISLVQSAIERQPLHGELHRPELVAVHDRIAERLRNWIIRLVHSIVLDGVAREEFRCDQPLEACEAIVASLSYFVHHPEFLSDTLRRNRMLLTIANLVQGLLEYTVTCCGSVRPAECVLEIEDYR